MYNILYVLKSVTIKTMQHIVQDLLFSCYSKVNLILSGHLIKTIFCGNSFLNYQMQLKIPVYMTFVCLLNTAN